MKTSKQWWEEVKNSPEKLTAWLKKQCYGELMAFQRINELANKYDNPILLKIAEQEQQHHLWLVSYLTSMGEMFDMSHEERYWKIVKTEFSSLEEAAAVGHLAETMRLERIKVISEDTETHPKLSEIFTKILKDELFHAQAFKSLTTEEQIELAKADHEAGMEALGLTI